MSLAAPPNIDPYEARLDALCRARVQKSWYTIHKEASEDALLREAEYQKSPAVVEERFSHMDIHPGSMAVLAHIGLDTAKKRRDRISDNFLAYIQARYPELGVPSRNTVRPLDGEQPLRVHLAAQLCALPATVFEQLPVLYDILRDEVDISSARHQRRPPSQLPDETALLFFAKSLPHKTRKALVQQFESHDDTGCIRAFKAVAARLHATTQLATDAHPRALSTFPHPVWAGHLEATRQRLKEEVARATHTLQVFETMYDTPASMLRSLNELQWDSDDDDDDATRRV